MHDNFYGALPKFRGECRIFDTNVFMSQSNFCPAFQDITFLPSLRSQTGIHTAYDKIIYGYSSIHNTSERTIWVSLNIV